MHLRLLGFSAARIGRIISLESRGGRSTSRPPRLGSGVCGTSREDALGRGGRAAWKVAMLGAGSEGKGQVVDELSRTSR